MTVDGKEVRFKAEGFLARVIQHEIDHTQGVVFIDHIKEKQDAYKEEIDIYRLASEMVVDDIIHPNQLRNELIKRYEVYADKSLPFTERKHGVYPV